MKIKWKEPSDYADKMDAIAFHEMADAGCFIPDDGIGFYGTDTKESDVFVFGNDVTFKEAEGLLTHVYWYNK
jgi:hypothetical protein